MAKWLYPFETKTNTSTLNTEKTSLGKRNRQVFVGEEIVQKVFQRFRIELEELSPDDPNVEFELQVVRDVLTCAPTFCGSAKVFRRQPRTGHKEVNLSERYLSVSLKEKINTTDGGPELQCSLKKDSIRLEYHRRSSEEVPKMFASNRQRSNEDSSSSSEDDSDSEDTDDSEDEDESEDMDEREETDGAGHGAEKKDKKGNKDKGESASCSDASLKIMRHLSTAPVTIIFTVCMERTFSERDWDAFQRFKAPEPKSAMLRDAENDGDVYLLTKDGERVAAHSTVLVKVPYFSALLEPTWKRKPQMPGQKLELDLPCPVGKTALQIFLNYVYGDTGPLFRISPLEAQLLQDILRLADACDVPALCSEIDSFASVTKENAELWLHWLREMRGSLR
eukprot:TRINITY_DN17963_c0_g1_i1.p1 TRINITY_DN17963_c0_g1~~TRINITY_DN17963_c0_g1_i1.p1  ORF type:complete len:393 (-),score=42.15 TRINITY_DN17963_c0_g1_i1:446-1624(-)